MMVCRVFTLDIAIEKKMNVAAHCFSEMNEQKFATLRFVVFHTRKGVLDSRAHQEFLLEWVLDEPESHVPK